MALVRHLAGSLGAVVGIVVAGLHDGQVPFESAHVRVGHHTSLASEFALTIAHARRGRDVTGPVRLEWWVERGHGSCHSDGSA